MHGTVDYWCSKEAPFDSVWIEKIQRSTTRLINQVADRLTELQDKAFSSSGRPSTRQIARYLQYAKEVQYNEDDGDNDQRMNPTAGAWDSFAYVPTEKTEQPQND